MKRIIFVAPYLMDATERFIDATTRVSDCQVGLVSCDPLEKLPAAIQARLTAHFRVNNIETGELLRGVQAIGNQLGGIDRILGMLEQIQVPLGEIRDHLKVPGMGAEASNNFRDKSVMKSVLRANGLPCAKHQQSGSLEQARQFANQCGYPVIIKPLDGAGAKGTFRCENDEHLAQCWSHLEPGSDNPVVLEEFITGKEHSFDSICINGQMIWSSISHYSPGPLEVVREPWIQWCVMIPREYDLPQYQPVKKIAQSALSALGMETGLSHMEWFLRPDGSIAISEVGARPPGAQFTTLISYAHDFDLYRAWAEAIIHEHFQIPKRKYAAGAAYLRGMGRGRVTEIQGLAEIAKTLDDVIVESKIPQLGQPPSGSYEGEGYIIVRHPETYVVQQALQRIIQTVQVSLEP